VHISDGVLSTPVIMISYAAAITITAISIHKIKNKDIPRISVMTSAFFVASLIHIPIGPTSVHLLLNGLIGIMLGFSAFPAILLGLVLQCLLFQFGGITALGANALMMGIPALIAAGIFSMRTRFKISYKNGLFAGIASAMAVTVSALILAALLALSGDDFIPIAKLALIAHIPVLIIETGMSVLIVQFLAKVRPAVLNSTKDIYAP